MLPKALAPTELSLLALLPMATLLRLWQPLKARSPIVVSSSGRLMEMIAVFLNAALYIIFKQEDALMVMLSKYRQSLKADSPM